MTTKTRERKPGTEKKSPANRANAAKGGERCLTADGTSAKKPTPDAAAPVRRKKPKAESGKPAAAGGNGAAPGRVGPLAASVVTHATIDIASVDPSPYQPRGAITEQELGELAESIRVSGQASPVLVRPGPTRGRYELIDGERRWRAAKLIGLKVIRAEVGRFTDKEVRALIAAASLHRQDLNAVQKGRMARRAIDAGDAAGPTELARQWGVSQGYVSNLLRLIELPEKVQARVISQEIPATHARELARFKEHPELVEQLADDLVDSAQWEGMPTVEDFRESLPEFLSGRLPEVDGDQWDAKAGRRVPHFTPTADQRGQLGIVAVEDHVGFGKKRKALVREFITNRALRDKLQAEHRKRWLKDNPPGKERKPANRENGAKGGKGGERCLTADGTSAKKLTPAQEAARAKEQAKLFAKRLARWQADWLRWLIAARIREEGVAEEVVLLLVLKAGEWGDRRYVDDRMVRFNEGAALRAACGECGLKVRSGLDASSTAAVLEQRYDGGKLGREFCSRLFWCGDKDGKGPVPLVPDRDVRAIAAWLEIDCEAAWLDDQAGDLSEAYWALHTREQLLDLAKELKLPHLLNAKKSHLVADFLDRRPGPDDKEVGLPLPRELRGRKAGSRERKTQGAQPRKAR